MLHGFKMLGRHLLFALECFFGQFILYAFGVGIALLIGLWITLPLRCAGMKMDGISSDDGHRIEEKRDLPAAGEQGEELPDKLFDE